MKLRVEMKNLKDRFHLEETVEDMKQIIAGKVSVAWEDLEDMKSSRLKRYGKVDPSLTSTLDTHIDKINHLLTDKILHILQ